MEIMLLPIMQTLELMQHSTNNKLASFKEMEPSIPSK